MKWDDLLGLFFLVVFLVLPALRGLLRSSPPEEGELLFPPEAAPPPPPPRERPKPKAKPEVRPVVLAPEPEPEPAPAKAAPRGKAKKPRLRLEFEESAILKGIVWHEILSEPRARRRWKPKR